MVFKPFIRKVESGFKNLVNIHIPKAVASSNKFLTSTLNVARTGHRLVHHVHTGVAQSELFSTKQKKDVARAAGFSDIGLQKLSDFHKQATGFSSHLASFRV
jgi:hypothetical protein